ncbi:actin, cytoplasmic 2 [Pelomyxa schiedti]|nr:actin, cytoplasmic 2 [Pelomyxa schiedti]
MQLLNWFLGPSSAAASTSTSIPPGRDVEVIVPSLSYVYTFKGGKSRVLRFSDSGFMRLDTAYNPPTVKQQYQYESVQRIDKYDEQTLEVTFTDNTPRLLFNSRSASADEVLDIFLSKCRLARHSPPPGYLATYNCPTTEEEEEDLASIPPITPQIPPTAQEKAGIIMGASKLLQSHPVVGRATHSVSPPTSPVFTPARSPCVVYDPILVLDCGGHFFKLGLAGHRAPHVRFPSLLASGVGDMGSLSALRESTYVGYKARTALPTAQRSPITKGMVTNWGDMTKLWSCGFKSLNLDPKDRTLFLTHSLISDGCSRVKLQHEFASCSFEKFSVRSIYLASRPVASLFSVDANTGLVVEVGDSLVQCVPVYACSPLHWASGSLDVAGRDVTTYLQQLLQSDNADLNSDFYTAEAQKETHAFVRSNLNTAPPTDVARSAFSQCMELLFDPTLMPGKSGPGLVPLSLRCLEHCDPDLVPILLQCILLSGGGAGAPGFAQRMQNDLSTALHYQASGGPHVFVANGGEGATTSSSWWGASKLACTLQAVDPNLFITKQEYDERGGRVLPWKCWMS